MRSLQQANRAHEDRAADPTNGRRGASTGQELAVLVVLVLLLQGWSLGRGLGLRVLRP